MKKALDKLAYLLSGSKYANVWTSILCVLLSLICSSIFLLALGKNPIVGFLDFLRGSGFLPKASYGANKSMLSDLFSFMDYLAPMILVTLSYIVGARAGLVNIGISGQMVASGFCAIVLVGYSDLSAWIAKPLAVIVGMVVGGLLGAFIGFLKYKFDISEIVSTIMLGYILNYLVGFAINNYFKNDITRAMIPASSEARLTLIDVNIAGSNCDVPLGLIIALVATVIIKFVLDKTTFGLELKGVGMNRKAAKYTGINTNKRIVQAMTISGILAGIAGVTYYCGYLNTIVPKEMPDIGYDAITVALLANNDPIGSIFAAILISIFQVGADYMSSQLGTVKEIASLITGIMLLFASCVTFIKYVAANRLKNIEAEEDEEGTPPAASGQLDGGQPAVVVATEGAGGGSDAMTVETFQPSAPPSGSTDEEHAQPEAADPGVDAAQPGEESGKDGELDA